MIGASGSGGPALLYVDALSFLGDFIGAGGSKFGMHGRPAQEDRWRDVLQARVNVRTFMREAKAAGWRVAVFFDMVKQDPHEIDKWWKRKVASAMAGGSNVMPFVTVMLGTLFEAEGATVHYAAEFDNDPTLAAYANIDNAVRPRVFLENCSPPCCSRLHANGLVETCHGCVLTALANRPSRRPCLVATVTFCVTMAHGRPANGFSCHGYTQASPSATSATVASWRFGRNDSQRKIAKKLAGS